MSSKPYTDVSAMLHTSKLVHQLLKK